MSEIRSEDAQATWMHRLDDPYRWYEVEPTAAGTRVDGLVLRGFTHLPVHAKAK